jgi:hypothetical protein
MGVRHVCESCGRRCRATAGGRSSCSAHGARRHGVSFTDGNGIAFRGGRTESGGSVGDAVHVLGCATPPRAVRSCCVGDRSHGSLGTLSRTYPPRAPSRDSPTCLRPSMIPVLMRSCAESAIEREKTATAPNKNGFSGPVPVPTFPITSVHSIGRCNTI